MTGGRLVLFVVSLLEAGQIGQLRQQSPSS